MATGQTQIRISISPQLGDLLKSKATRLGVPLTQFVKHLIIKTVETEEVPTFQASKWLEHKTEKALKNIDKAVEINNVDDFFKNL